MNGRGVDGDHLYRGFAPVSPPTPAAISVPVSRHGAWAVSAGDGGDGDNNGAEP